MKKYSADLTLSDYELPDPWTWENPDQNLSVGTNNYIAISGNYKYEISITVAKGKMTAEQISQIEKPSNLFANEGEKLRRVTLPDNWVWKDGSELVKKSNNKYDAIYKDGNYESVTIELDVIGVPVFENVKYKHNLKYSDQELPQGWTWKNPDTTLTLGDNYTSAIYDDKEYNLSVYVIKGDYTLSQAEIPSDLSGKESSKLSSVKLPEDWSWKDPDTKLSLETSLYAAIYKDPSGFYNDVEIELEVIVIKNNDESTSSGTENNPATNPDNTSGDGSTSNAGSNSGNGETSNTGGNSDNEKEVNKSENETTTSKSLAVGTIKTYGIFKYKVISKTGVSILGFKKASYKKTKKTISIPKTVKLAGKTYKVTKIANKAFTKCKKLKKATIGANVTQIGTKAFFKSQKLSRIIIKTKKLKKVGASAFKKLWKSVKIKVPASKKNKYKSLLKKKINKDTTKII